MNALEFLEAVEAEPIPEDIRLGQHAFNRLLDIRPDLAKRARGTDIDPFGYRYIPEAFRGWLCETWPEEPGTPQTDSDDERTVRFWESWEWWR